MDNKYSNIIIVIFLLLGLFCIVIPIYKIKQKDRFLMDVIYPCEITECIKYNEICSEQTGCYKLWNIAVNIYNNTYKYNKFSCTRIFKNINDSYCCPYLMSINTTLNCLISSNIKNGIKETKIKNISYKIITGNSQFNGWIAKYIILMIVGIIISSICIINCIIKTVFICKKYVQDYNKKKDYFEFY